VHDEIVVCCRPDIAEQIGELLVRHAREAGKHYALKVPLDADYKICRNWAGEAVNANATAAEPQPITQADRDEINAGLKREGITPIAWEAPSGDAKCAKCRPTSFVVFPDRSMTPVEAAAALAAQGVQTFPAPPNQKKSYKSEKFSGTRWGMTKDLKEIRRDFRHWPDAQIGLPAGKENGFFVVEADTKEGHDVDGIASIARLEARNESLPPTLMAQSPSGSLHHYFRHPGHGIEIRNSQSKIAPGVDVRGDGGMVIAPPSHRKDGQYHWLNANEIAEPPPWLLELVTMERVQTPGSDTPAGKAIDVEALLAAMTYQGDDNNGIHTTQLSVSAALLNYPDYDVDTVTQVLLEATRRAAGANGANWDWKREERDIRGMCNGWLHKHPELEAANKTDAPKTNGSGQNDGSGDQTAKSNNDQKQEAKAPSLVFIDMSRWDDEPTPEQEWIVYNRIPRRECVLFSGEGGAGKSIEQLHLSVAAVLERDWLGIIPEQGPVIFIDAEDDEKVLHRRTKAIAAHYGANITEMIKGGLHLASWRGCDAALAVVARNGQILPTPLYKTLLETAGDIKPVMIGIAASANVFAGNENDRAQVQQFIGLLTRVAMVADGSIALISHPSLAGINTETGLSGTTQWHNSVRARYFMRGVKPEAGEPLDTDLREIVFKKNNYGSISESIVLRWNNGLFLPADGLDPTAKEAAAKEVFLKLLKRFRTANRNASDKPGPTFAPALFAKEDEARSAGLTSKNLERAMRQLFRDKQIVNEEYGKASNTHYRLAVKQ
jgi:RecA-family ATPase